MSEGITRRTLLTDAAIGAAGIAAVGLAAGAGEASAEIDQTNENLVRHIVEFPVPNNYDADRPDQNEYEVDVLVIGAGYAGMNAAQSAKEAGMDVMVLDKGRPGYSGQSAWPGTHCYYDPDYDCDPIIQREYIRHASEYFANLDWYDVWINESKSIFERIQKWGVLEMYPRLCDTEYYDTRDYYGYRDSLNFYETYDRHPLFVKQLDSLGIPWIEHVMVTDVIVQDDRCVGAVGFQVTTGEIIEVHAKAVVMAMGNGAIIPTGHPVGDNTFDGEYIAYNLGLPITGKEFEDYHTHQSIAAGNNWLGSDSRWIDPMFLTSNNASASRVAQQKESAENGTLKAPVNPDGMPYMDAGSFFGHISEITYGDNGDMRIGKKISPYVEFDAPGGAAGMCLHTSSGVFCGLDDLEGYTGIPGLYVAGDGMHHTQCNGVGYTYMGGGFTSNFTAIEGDHAGKAAAAYAQTVDLERISDESYQAAVDKIEEPLNLDTGFSPTWARDALQGIMSPYWVLKNKTEETLNAALVQVKYMQDHVAPRLMARNGHTLRLAHEMKHKINACVLKLTAALDRKESRGENNNFYRDDYPERDDENWSKYIILTKGEDGYPEISYVPLKEEWLAGAAVPIEELEAIEAAENGEEA